MEGEFGGRDWRTATRLAGLPKGYFVQFGGIKSQLKWLVSLEDGMGRELRGLKL